MKIRYFLLSLSLFFAPFTQAQEIVLEAEKGSSGEVDFNWDAYVGKTYFWQTSLALDNDWIHMPQVIAGDDTNKERSVLISNADKLFARVVSTNQTNDDVETADFDLDGYSNIQEVSVLGTDPLNIDTDGDGTQDGHEDTDSDGLPDGWEKLMVDADPNDAWTDINQITPANVTTVAQETGQNSNPPIPSDEIPAVVVEWQYRYSDTAYVESGQPETYRTYPGQIPYGLTSYDTVQNKQLLDLITDSQGNPIGSPYAAVAAQLNPIHSFDKELGWLEHDLSDGLSLVHIDGAGASAYQFRVKLNKAALVERTFEKTYLMIRQENETPQNWQTTGISPVKVTYRVEKAKQISEIAQVKITGQDFGISTVKNAISATTQYPGSSTLKGTVDLLPIEIFLDNQNITYSLDGEALGISNFETTSHLSQNSTFTGSNDDPENFRLEARVFDHSITSVPITLEVVRNGSVAVTHNYTLDQKSGEYLRGRFLRLVRDTVDDAASGAGATSDPNNQTILVQLGDTVRATYQVGSTPVIPVIQEIRVGRPMIEQCSCLSHKDYDDRELKVNIVVMQKFDGSGPAITRTSVDSHVRVATETLTQAGIRVSVININMGVNDTGVAMPTGAGIDYSNGFDAVTGDFSSVDAHPEEDALFELKDDDKNTIDVFIVDSFSLAATTLNGSARAYISNGSDGIKKYKSNVILTSATSPSGFTLAHEFMHILLDDIHRSGESSVSLFKQGTALQTNDVHGPKRIGHFFPASSNSISKDDTVTIRSNSEILP